MDLEKKNHKFAVENNEADWMVNHQKIKQNELEINHLNNQIQAIKRINNIHIQSLNQFEMQNRNIALSKEIKEAKEWANIIASQNVVDVIEAEENATIAKRGYEETEDISNKLNNIADNNFSNNFDPTVESEDHLAFLKDRENSLLDANKSNDFNESTDLNNK